MAVTSAVRSDVRVVVVGDRGSGKSSLIATAASDRFPENVPSLLSPTRLPADYFPDRVPVTIIDTSSSLEIRGKLLDELRRADAVVITYACDQPMSISRLSTVWLHELRQLQLKVPVIIAGCKLDLKDDSHQRSLQQMMTPIMQQYREIETCIECSAANEIQVPDVFYYAQKAVLHPTAPLFDHATHTLKPRCMRALKRIFMLCDNDRDGVLSDEELNKFQVKCFNSPLHSAEIAGIKRVIEEKLPAGVNELGLTLAGFLFLHALFIEKGRLETTWTVLRKFGYDNDIKLRDDFLPVLPLQAPDQSVELTTEAMEFLKKVFRMFDLDNDGILQPAELDDLFSTAPGSPWDEAPYENAAERTASGGLSLLGFLSKWVLMTLLDPACSLANLIYIGYPGDPASAVHLTRGRSLDRRKRQTQRNVIRCFVFGPKNAGKSTFLNSFLGRPFSPSHMSTTEECYATNVVELLGGNEKTLVLQEIPEDKTEKLLSNKQSLAACDVAVFLFDSSDEHSWKRATELLVEVARQGEETGYGMPCLLVAAKDDLNSYSVVVKDSARVCQGMGIGTPIPVSAKLRDLNSIFCRIVYAAEYPHLSIPETESAKNLRRYCHLINHSLMFLSRFCSNNSGGFCCNCWICCLPSLRNKEECLQLAVEKRHRVNCCCFSTQRTK